MLGSALKSGSDYSDGQFYVSNQLGQGIWLSIISQCVYESVSGRHLCLNWWNK